MRATRTLLSLLLLLGCSKTVLLNSDAARRDLNERGARKTGRIDLVNGAHCRGRGVTVRTDSLHFLERKARRLVVLPVDSVYRVDFVNHGEAAIKGFFYWGIVPLAVVMPFSWDRADLAWGVGEGILNGLLMMIPASVVGYHHVYIVNPDSLAAMGGRAADPARPSQDLWEGL